MALKIHESDHVHWVVRVLAMPFSLSPTKRFIYMQTVNMVAYKYFSFVRINSLFVLLISGLARILVK